MHTTKIFCCRCEDIYYPRSSRQANVDGAYFGTTFCHLFLQSYWELAPQQTTTVYTPRIFGFKIHKPQGTAAVSAGRAAAMASASASSAAAAGSGAAAGGGAGEKPSAAAGGSANPPPRLVRMSHDADNEDKGGTGAASPRAGGKQKGPPTPRGDSTTQADDHDIG
jgi:hypothetical protein